MPYDGTMGKTHPVAGSAASRPVAAGTRPASFRIKDLSVTITPEQIERGLPVRIVDAISLATGLGDARVRKLSRISSSSFARRQKSGSFTPEESDRLARLGRIMRSTLDFFDGDLDEARRWLEAPAPALDGKKPIDLIINDAGVKAVEDLLIRLEHGVFT